MKIWIVSFLIYPKMDLTIRKAKESQINFRNTKMTFKVSGLD